MKTQVETVVLLLSMSVSDAGVEVVQVVGQVLDSQGKPVAEARVAGHWFTERNGPLAPDQPALSGPDGQFKLEIKLSSRDAAGPGSLF